MTSPRVASPHFLSLDRRVLDDGALGGARSTGCDRRVRGALPGGVRPRDRALLAWATRFARMVPSQAWRWFFPDAGSVKVARNRLRELEVAGLLVRVPLRQGQEGVYIPTQDGSKMAEVGLSAPKVPATGDLAALGKLGHSLTVAEAAWWLLHRPDATPDASWLTERELAREAVLALPPVRRRGARGVGPLPDGALCLPDGERLAVEVELHDKAARLGIKLAWYRDGAGFAGVLWLTHREAVRRSLERAIAAAGCAGLMWTEALPPDLPVWVG